MKHIYRITLVAEGIRSQFWGVASDIQKATELAVEASGLTDAEVTNAVAVGHLDFEEITDGA